MSSVFTWNIWNSFFNYYMYRYNVLQRVCNAFIQAQVRYRSIYTYLQVGQDSQ